MTPRLISPCGEVGADWLRGNLHTHSTLSDGNLGIQETVRAYADLHYDFLMLSDHDVFNDGAKLDSCGMTIIPGNEITANGVHLLHVNAEEYVQATEDRQGIIEHINKGRGFAVLNHPNWEKDFNHCPQQVLEELQGYAGIEIYNGVCLFAEGSPLATDRWDMLLSRGRRVWGYGNDDNHADAHRGLVWNMVQAASRSAGDIAAALRTGRFYVSTGVRISRIAAEGATLIIETENAECLHIYGDYQQLVQRIDGRTVSYTVPEDTEFTYLRVECFGRGDRMAWSQPFFIDRG
jgi:hypothetical protein